MPETATGSHTTLRSGFFSFIPLMNVTTVRRIFSDGINPSFITLISGMERAETAASSLTKSLFFTAFTFKTSLKFCAVTAVIAATPITPKKFIVVRSAVTPAPLELSVAAIVRTETGLPLSSNIFIYIFLLFAVKSVAESFLIIIFHFSLFIFLISTFYFYFLSESPARAFISLLIRIEQNFGPHIEQNSDDLWHCCGRSSSWKRLASSGLIERAN